MPDLPPPEIRRPGTPVPPAVARTEHVIRTLPSRWRERPDPRRYAPFAETVREIDKAIAAHDGVLDRLRAELTQAAEREQRLQVDPAIDTDQVVAATAMRQDIEADLARFTALRDNLTKRRDAAAERERAVLDAYLPQLAALRARNEALHVRLAEYAEAAQKIAALMEESAAIAREVDRLEDVHKRAITEGVVPFPEIGARLHLHRNALIPGATRADKPFFDGRQTMVFPGLPPGVRAVRD